jgi:hypothetical protein
VIVIDADGKLVKSSQPNAPNVVGVYSTNPAFIGDPRGARELKTPDGRNVESENVSEEEMLQAMEADQDDGLIPVGLVGIIPTNVSAENGPIRPGDLLTTSATEGHAMKASPLILSGIEFYAPGTIIGKALEPHESGTGLIKVLVTLQ